MWPLDGVDCLGAGKVLLRCWGPGLRGREIDEVKQRQFCEWWSPKAFDCLMPLAIEAFWQLLSPEANPVT